MTTKKTVSDPGTRFPFVNLEKAVGRAKQLYEADMTGRPMLVTAAFEVWEYSEKSSGGFQTIAALKSYGLLDKSDAGESRKIGLSSDALKYFKDEREDERAKLIKGFALRPPLLHALWNDWGAAPPADMIARSTLKVDRGLNEQSARTLLTIYKDNLSYCELINSDMFEWSEDENIDESLPPQTGREQVISPDFEASILKPPEAKPGMKQDIFTLDEGDVIFQWPEKLSEESFADLEGWMVIQMRKIKRHIDKPASDPNPEVDTEARAAE